MSTEIARRYEDRFRFLDEKLRPIANRPVRPIGSPQKLAEIAKTLASRPHPVDEAGVRFEAEILVHDVMETYAIGSDEDRESIRELLRRYPSASWAIPGPRLPPTTDAGFRSWLLFISMLDQDGDPRNVMVGLWDKCRQANDAGVLIGPILEEVARISSDEDSYGYGSMRSMLLSAERRMR
jgi:hypothetical protein